MERPILFCEGFEVAGPAPIVAGAAAAPRRLAGGQGGARYTGLCANCENRRTCTIARPEGGVWHCEEYR